MLAPGYSVVTPGGGGGGGSQLRTPPSGLSTSPPAKLAYLVPSNPTPTLTYRTPPLPCPRAPHCPVPWPRYKCLVRNNGPMDGDEVLMVFHEAGDHVRARARHPVPQKALVQFQRVHVPNGATAEVTLKVRLEKAKLVNEHGDRVMYAGGHSFIISRGHGRNFVHSFTLPLRK